MDDYKLGCKRDAFAVAAPHVWNSLPTDIKLHRSMTTSSNAVLTVLFNRGFAEYM